MFYIFLPRAFVSWLMKKASVISSRILIFIPSKVTKFSPVFVCVCLCVYNVSKISRDPDNIISRTAQSNFLGVGLQLIG